jgi:hypothetical protein
MIVPYLPVKLAVREPRLGTRNHFRKGSPIRGANEPSVLQNPSHFAAQFLMDEYRL